MTEWKKVYLYLKGRKGKNILIVFCLCMVILSNLLGLGMFTAAENAKKEAFLFNGEALFFNGVTLEDEQIEALAAVEHVTGIDTRKWWTVDISPLTNVSYHTGAEVSDYGQEDFHHEIFMMTNWDVTQDSWFRWEPNVALTEGEYPTAENRGLLIEARLAEENGLQVGDTLSITVEDTPVNFVICGIFQVDADFELLPETDVDYLGYGDEMGRVDIYGVSPYNRVYANAAYVYGQVSGERLGESADCTWKIFVDAYENYETVAENVRNILGENATIYDNASDYLESSTATVVIMENIARLIVNFVTLAGLLIFMIIMTFIANEFTYETSLYLALGKNKKWVLLHDLHIFLVLFILAFSVAVGLYCMVGGPVMQTVKHISDSYISLEGSSYYRIIGLEEGFSLSVSVSDIVTAGNFIRLSMGAVVLVLIAMLIPSWCIRKSKATDLFR